MKPAGTPQRGAVPITGRAGDLLVYIGQCWHSFGVNQVDHPRPALLGQVLPFFMKPMEAHAWTLPVSVQRRLPEHARRLLGLFPAAFFQHSLRLAPMPRTPMSAVRFVVDSLVYGYAGPHHPEMLRKGLDLMQVESPTLRALALSPSINAAYWQLWRWLTLAALLGGPLFVHCCHHRSTKN